jgi:NAD+ diphosphatase
MADRTERSLAPRPVAFAGGTLDRAGHLRGDEADGLRRLDTSRALLIGAEQTVAVTDTGGELVRVPTLEFPDDALLTFLGLEATGAAAFAYDAADRDGSKHEFAALRQLGAELEPGDAALAAYATGMVGWHRVHRHCGRCGHATDVEQTGHRRRCPNCGLLQFPRTDPAVTMLVQAGERCLLSRRQGAPTNRWSALAGFVEPGETPEEAVVREASEETGVRIDSVKYVVSQPWPFPSALMIGFWAFVDAETDIAEALEPQAGELVEVRWWERSELAEAIRDDSIALPPPGTIGNYLISTWLAGG